jgi:hypothetical protein
MLAIIRTRREGAEKKGIRKKKTENEKVKRRNGEPK